MSKPIGSVAFPNDFFRERGMSLRQWYIGKALGGLCAHPDIHILPAEEIARLAIENADAVMRLLYGSSRTESQNETKS